MDARGLRAFADAVESNVVSASRLHNLIGEAKDREIAELRDQLEAIREREDRMWDRLRWLCGYDDNEV